MIFPKGLASSQSQEKYVISIFLALPVKRGIGTVSRCKVGPHGESPPQGWDGVGGLRDGMHWLCCCCFDCCLQFHRFSLKFPLEWLKIPKFSRLNFCPSASSQPQPTETINQPQSLETACRRALAGQDTPLSFLLIGLDREVGAAEHDTGQGPSDADS